MIGIVSRRKLAGGGGVGGWARQVKVKRNIAKYAGKHYWMVSLLHVLLGISLSLSFLVALS